MYTVTVTGFETKEQAEAFVGWFINAGEQALSDDVEENYNLGVRGMNTDMSKYTLDWKDDNIELPLTMYHTYD